jgi:transcriptional regulator with XRE-family HTH domain
VASEPLRQALGARVRSARHERELSLSELADASGLSKALLSTIERGEGNPSVNTLFQLATALGTTVSQLIDAEDEGPEVVRAGGGRVVSRDDRGIDARIVFASSGHRRFEIYEGDMAPRSRSEWTLGRNMTEYLTVHQGRAHVGRAGSTHLLGPGDSIALTLEGPCIIEALDEPVRLTSVTAYGY